MSSPAQQKLVTRGKHAEALEQLIGCYSFG